MTKYLLVDSLNTFMRARHSASRRLDSWTKIGFAMHVTLSIINKSFHKEKADHVVFCTEGRSWRKDIYEPYKKNRKHLADKRTEDQVEEDQEFMDAFSDMIKYISEKTHCTVLNCSIAEADDLIARWIKLHPNDEHVILSSDSDFVQLLSENVHIYNGINNQLITLDGYFDDDGNPIKNKKTKEIMEKPDPEWHLFEKCIRGDSSDNIFSAYPGARMKSTKNKIGIRDAYNDKHEKGFIWNNFMLQRWTDHKDVEHRVIKDYTRNQKLIDLTQQPDDIKEKIDETIKNQSIIKTIPYVGRYFLQFCGKYELNKLSDYSTQYVDWLGSKYE